MNISNSDKIKLVMAKDEVGNRGSCWQNRENQGQRRPGGVTLFSDYR